MTTFQQVYVIDVIKLVVADMVNFGVNPPNLFLGRSAQINKELQEATMAGNGVTDKYPMYALYWDFPERAIDGIVEVTFPKMIFATLTEIADNTTKRYEDNFKTKLYPLYIAFLKSLAKSKYTVINDWRAIEHTKYDRPGNSPVNGNPHEYLDIIDVLNLKISFIQSLENCN